MFTFQYDQTGGKEEIDLDESLAHSDGKIKFDDVGDDDSMESSEEGDDNYEANHRLVKMKDEKTN